MAEATIRVKVVGDNLPFIADMEKTRKSIDGVKGSVDTLSKSLGAIKASALVYLAQQAEAAMQKVYAFARGIASSAMEIERQSKILGMSTSAYQKLSYAAKMSDIDIGDFSIGMKMLSKTMEEAIQGTGDGSKWFAAMGLSAKDASGKMKPLDEMMGEIADKFASWEDGPKKMAIALALFGRSGQNMIPILNQGSAGIKRYGDELVRMGSVIGDVVIKKGTEAEDIFKQIETQVNATKIQMAPFALEVAKAFKSALDTLNDVKKSIQSLPQVVRDALAEVAMVGIRMVPFVGPLLERITRKSMAAPAIPEPQETRFKLPTQAKGQPPSLPNEADLKLQQKMLEDSAKAWGDYADEIFSSLEKMQMDIIAEQKATNAEIDKLMEQDVESWLSAIEEKERADFDYYSGLADLQRKSNEEEERLIQEGLAGDLAAIETKQQAEFNYYRDLAELQKRSNELTLRAKEMLPGFQMEYAVITGNFEDMMKAQKDLLQVEMERIIRENELTGIYKEQVELLYKAKQAEVEAVRTLNIPKLVDIGNQKAFIKYNEDLANQFENLLPNSLDIFQNAFEKAFDANSFKDFFTDLSKGFKRLAEDIMFTIAKMEILKMLGYGGGGGIAGLFGGGMTSTAGLGLPTTPAGYGFGGPWAEGGYVTKPTIGLIGEKGPEFIIPEKRMKSGQSISINMPITISHDLKPFAAQLRRETEAFVDRRVRELSR